MSKVLRSDRDETKEELPTKVTKLPYHDFNQNPVLEMVYFATDPAGHYFGNAAAEVMVPCDDSYKTVNIALTNDVKGKKIRITYDGFSEEENRGLFHVELVD